MSPCISPDCTQPKQAGQGKKYCVDCLSTARRRRRVADLARLREWENTNPERVREIRRDSAREWNRRPENRLRRSERKKTQRAADPIGAFADSLRQRYNITVEQYNALLRAQGGCCALCRRPASSQKRRLHVDHDHRCCASIGKSCGKCVRGLLCVGCNRLLGWYENNQLAIGNYIKQPIGEQ